MLSTPEMRWVITRLELRLADLAMLVLPFLFLTRPTTFGGTTLVGLDMATGMLVLGQAGITVGWIWVRRIARGTPEPEANDRFWWSRA